MPAAETRTIGVQLDAREPTLQARPAEPAGNEACRDEGDQRHRELDPAERDARDEERRPDDAERGEAEQVPEPGEPEHAAPRSKGEEPPEKRETDDRVPDVQRRDPGEGARAHDGRFRIASPCSVSSQTGCASGYAPRSQAKQRIQGASGSVLRGRRKYRM